MTGHETDNPQTPLLISALEKKYQEALAAWADKNDAVLESTEADSGKGGIEAFCLDTSVFLWNTSGAWLYVMKPGVGHDVLSYATDETTTQENLAFLMVVILKQPGEARSLAETGGDEVTAGFDMLIQEDGSIANMVGKVLIDKDNSSLVAGQIASSRLIDIPEWLSDESQEEPPV